MRGEVRKIDPTLGLGLHELANSGKGRCRPDSLFSFQLEFAMTQANDILDKLGNLVENTIKKAPVRAKDKDFKLCREPNTTRQFCHEEVNWERAMHKKWGPKGSGEFVPICSRIQTYQYPLKATSKDKCWGEIDLLGVGKDGLPVPIELKKAKTYDSPLRMVVEVAAYGFAIQKVWPNLREHWAKALSVAESQLPEKLERVTLVCVAPEAYWHSCTGLHRTIPGAFPAEAWPCFWHLVDHLKPWFEIHFVALEGILDDGGGLPTITGAHELDLRSLTMKSATGNPDSAQQCE